MTGHNHKNYNFLDCGWFEKLFFTNSVVKLLSDGLLLDSLLSDNSITNRIQSSILNQPISFVSLLMQNFPSFYNLALLLFSEIVIFMIN